jgi:hypothetical protein
MFDSQSSPWYISLSIPAICVFSVFSQQWRLSHQNNKRNFIPVNSRRTLSGSGQRYGGQLTTKIRMHPCLVPCGTSRWHPLDLLLCRNKRASNLRRNMVSRRKMSVSENNIWQHLQKQISLCALAAHLPTKYSDDTITKLLLAQASLHTHNHISHFSKTTFLAWFFLIIPGILYILIGTITP